jgi:hypothetical protein
VESLTSFPTPKDRAEGEVVMDEEDYSAGDDWWSEDDWDPP